MGKRILHVIDSLARGGAELLLIRFIASLPQDYENFLVILYNKADLLAELANVAKIYKLDMRRKDDVLCSAVRMRAIIQEQDITIVHAHLYWATIVARLATPVGVPLVFTVHNELSKEVFKGSVAGKWLERLTYSLSQQAVFVSEAAKADYASHIALGYSAEVIYNFVGDEYFEEGNKHKSFSSGKLRLVSVANLKHQKNHQLLLQAMSELGLPEVSLDIIGEGPERANLQKQINDLGLEKVFLRGAQTNVAITLKNYDAFVLASKFEGFCVAMVEAMAVGLPCLVSNLPVLREVSEEKQCYFAPGDVDDLVKHIRLLINRQDKLEQLKQAGIATAQKYRIGTYTAETIRIYERLTG